MVEEKQVSIYFCKRYIAQMRMNLTGSLDGDTPPVSPPFLVLEQASLYCLTTICNLKLRSIFFNPKRRSIIVDAELTVELRR